MKAAQVLISGTAGTTFMTFFSYFVSAIEKENFSEPERLAQLTNRLTSKLGNKQSQAIGWSGHYAVGLLFALVYVELWRRKKIEPTFKNNVLLGAVSGLVAVAIWKATFKLHPLPPRLSFSKYYLQLVPAHVVFAIFAGLAFKLLNAGNLR